jgi:hypothetical protein
MNIDEKLGSHFSYVFLRGIAASIFIRDKAALSTNRKRG